jgi:hypothetical protein
LPARKQIIGRAWRAITLAKWSGNAEPQYTIPVSSTLKPAGC